MATMEGLLSTLFLAELAPDLRSRFEAVPDRELESALAAAFDTGVRAWPGIDVDPARFVCHVASHVDGDAALTALQSADVYLAIACIDGNKLALATFDREMLAPVAPAVHSTGLDAAGADEVLQTVRMQILVGNDGIPGIANYSGRGQLRSWVRAVALRRAIDMFRARRETPVDDDALAAMPALAHDAELAPWKHQYAEAFRAAFATAVARLDERQRTLLRQHHVDQLSIDDLARLHKVHRATVARWIAAARESLLADIREQMIEQLSIAGSELDSALRIARSQLGISIHRLYGGNRRKPR
jgi:RNA polymerase sigma-70 factor (ECF subfamily)